MTDHFAVLGVSRNATSAEIRDAYLKLARTTHPDTVRDPEARKKAETVFKSVTAAYDTLSKERSRRDYAARLPPESEQSPPSTAAARGPSVPAQAAAPSNPVPSTGPFSVDALAQGIEAYKKKDYHTAVQLLNRAVSQDEGNAKAHAILALTMAKNPNWVRDAVKHMENASRLDPKNVSYLAELALLLQSQGLKLRAKKTLERAIAIKADHPDVIRAKAEIPIAPSEPESQAESTSETSRGLFDRLRKR
jgi:tetratricopeptide (TPR) repeat protein